MSMYGDGTQKQRLYDAIDYERREEYADSFARFLVDLTAILADYLEQNEYETTKAVL